MIKTKYAGLACASFMILAGGVSAEAPFKIKSIWSTNPSSSLTVRVQADGQRELLLQLAAQADDTDRILEQVTGQILSIEGSQYDYVTQIDNLLPEAAYRFRVGDGFQWSPWHPFFTAAAAINFPPTRIPDRVILTWAADPATSMAVSWRTDSSVTRACAQIAPASDSPEPPKESRALSLEKYRHPSGKTQVALTKPLISDVKAQYHSVKFAGLEPETVYSYRLGDCERIWSAWFHFTTASREIRSFSFIYFGDIQNSIRSMAARVIRQAILQNPGAKFHLYAGDLVGTPNDLYWGEWFESAGWVRGSIPTVPITGNHEYSHASFERSGGPPPHVGSLPYWREIFTLPEHGPEGQEETVYYIDYQGVRFIAMNSNELLFEPHTRTRQLNWLRTVLKDNPNQWTCVAFHHPIWQKGYGEDRLSALLQPIFDEYRVALVMTGHTHYYSRGHFVSQGQAQSARGGTVYMTSSATPATNGSSDPGTQWDRVGEDLQLYQVVSVSAGKLSVDTYTATGKLYDAFDLIRQGKGRPNRLINRVPDDYPERRRQRTATFPAREPSSGSQETGRPSPRTKFEH